jgi:uncharacterized membrane protein
MSDQMPASPGEVTSNDRLLSALGYPIFLIPLFVLFTEQKNKPFMKYHAVQSLLLNVVIFIASVVLGFTVILAICAPFLWLVTLWPAYKAYQGEYVVLPVLTDFMKGQGWA